MTLSLTDVLLGVIAISAVVVAVNLSRASGQIARSALEIERAVQSLSPRIDRVLQECNELMSHTRVVLQRVDRIAEDASSVSQEAREVAVPVIRDLRGLRDGTRQLAAIAEGVRVGVSALIRRL